MRQWNLLMAALVLTTALPERTEAQLRVQAADRVRILAHDGSSLTGVVTELSGDSLEVKGTSDRRWVRQADVAYLERSSKRYRRFGRNFAATVGSVAGVSGMLTAITWKKCVSNELFGCFLAPETRGDAFMLGAVGGAVFSVPLGVILGLALQYDHWEPAQMSQAGPSRLTVKPQLHRGLGVSASFAF